MINQNQRRLSQKWISLSRINSLNCMVQIIVKTQGDLLMLEESYLWDNVCSSALLLVSQNAKQLNLDLKILIINVDSGLKFANTINLSKVDGRYT